MTHAAIQDKYNFIRDAGARQDALFKRYGIDLRMLGRLYDADGSAVEAHDLGIVGDECYYPEQAVPVSALRAKRKAVPKGAPPAPAAAAISRPSSLARQR